MSGIQLCCVYIESARLNRGAGKFALARKARHSRSAVQGEKRRERLRDEGHIEFYVMHPMIHSYSSALGLKE